MSRPRHGHDNSHVHIGQCVFDGISALQHGNIRLKPLIQNRVSTGGKIHVGNGVVKMIVLARGVDHQFGLEFVQKRQDQFIKGMEKALFSSLGRQRNVDGFPLRIRTSRLIGKTTARIKGCGRPDEWK